MVFSSFLCSLLCPKNETNNYSRAKEGKLFFSLSKISVKKWLDEQGSDHTRRDGVTFRKLLSLFLDHAYGLYFQV